ncbi:unnamed protein product [Rotaria sp. Silwood2]|nr:unnamed protein product [Rotaria sp. Silwood2]CAF4460843.1 unnamed protein product [Rotaria sp. Silwood2]
MLITLFSQFNNLPEQITHEERIRNILHDKTSSISSFDQLIRYPYRLPDHVILTSKIIQFIKILFQNKQFKDELFSSQKLYYWLNRLVESFHDWSMFSMEFLDLLIS